MMSRYTKLIFALAMLCAPLAHAQDVERAYTFAYNGDICHVDEGVRIDLKRNVHDVPSARVLQSFMPRPENCDPQQRGQQGEIDARWADMERILANRNRLAEKLNKPEIFPLVEQANLLCHSAAGYHCLHHLAQIDPEHIQIDWLVATAPVFSPYTHRKHFGAFGGSDPSLVRESDPFRNTETMEKVRIHLSDEASKGMIIVATTADQNVPPADYIDMVTWAGENQVPLRVVVFAPNKRLNSLPRSYQQVATKALENGFPFAVIPFTETPFETVRHNDLPTLGGRILQELRAGEADVPEPITSFLGETS